MSKSDSDQEENALLISYDISSELGTEFDHSLAYSLEDKIAAALTDGIGVLDGHDFGYSEATLYIYGPNADEMYAAISDILKAFVVKPIRVRLRYGLVDDIDVRITDKVLT